MRRPCSASEASSEASLKLAALDRAQATIEFTPTGEILNANKNFLDLVGYSLSEIKGRHHRMFVVARMHVGGNIGPSGSLSHQRRVQKAVYRRIGKNGAVSLDPGGLQSAHRPARPCDEGGEVRLDVTEQKMLFAEYESQLDRAFQVAGGDPVSTFRAIF